MNERDAAMLCQCGHPREAHRLNYGGPRDHGGHVTAQESCVAVVTKHDYSFPCACVNFREAKSLCTCGSGSTAACVVHGPSAVSS